MTTKRFNSIISETLTQCVETLGSKAKEYATEDRLHNFRIAAILQNCTVEQALSGMMAKHVISIYDMCRSGESYTEAMWQEKIGDAINYLLLLKAAVSEVRDDY